MLSVLRSIVRYFYALISAVYLFTVGWMLSGRARGLVAGIAHHFGFPSSEYHLPIIELSDIVGPDCRIQLAELATKNGNISLEELSSIAAIVRHFTPKTIFEIGTFDGRTTLNMALNSPAETKIFTLDLPREEIDTTALHITTGDRVFVNKSRSGARFAGTEYAAKITQIYGDSARFDFSPYFGKIDLVFVDGSHAYDYVRNDTQIALKLLREGHGVILWHDYSAWVGVTRALNELSHDSGVLSGMQNVKGTTLVWLKL